MARCPFRHMENPGDLCTSQSSKAYIFAIPAPAPHQFWIGARVHGASGLFALRPALAHPDGRGRGRSFRHSQGSQVVAPPAKLATNRVETEQAEEAVEGTQLAGFELNRIAARTHSPGPQYPRQPIRPGGCANAHLRLPFSGALTAAESSAVSRNQLFAPHSAVLSQSGPKSPVQFPAPARCDLWTILREPLVDALYRQRRTKCVPGSGAVAA
jgi:hypothetical protein